MTNPKNFNTKAAIACIGASIVGIFAYIFKAYFIIYMPWILFSMFNKIEPNHPVDWKATVDTRTDHRPNIILILADDLGFNDITFYGGGVYGGKVSTPHIDSIGKDGVSFKHAYSGHATCAPSRAALMTGRYSSRSGYEYTPTHPMYTKILGTSPKALRKGIYHEDIAKTLTTANMTLPQSEITMAKMLRGMQYKTLQIGKWHLGDTATSNPLSHGFDESLGFNIISRYLSNNDPASRQFRLDDMLDKLQWANVPYRVSKDNGSMFEPKGYMTDYLAEEACHAIKANKNNPFFMYLAFSAVHTPLEAHQSDYDRLSYIPDELTRVYGAMVLALDRAVGKVLHALSENGLEENTLVIFTNDNGAPNWVMRPDVNLPLRGWKGTFFEGGIRVPLFMKWPKVLPKQLEVTSPVSHVDLFPTFLAAANMFESHIEASNPSAILDGVNLFPHILSSLSSRDVTDKSLVHNNTLLNRTIFWRSGHYKAFVKHNFKLKISQRPNKMWLYDLSADPYEQRNLANQSDYERIRVDLFQSMQRVEGEQSEPLWSALTETAVLVDKLFEFNETLDDEYIYWPN